MTLERWRQGLAVLCDARPDLDGLFITGGEPTGLPWLLDAIASARDAGFGRIQLQTHAGAFAEGAAAAALVAAGVTAVDVPLYGPDSATHEAITGTAGSFQGTLAGLAALRARGVAAVVHCTIFTSNASRLGELLRFVDQLAPDAAYLQLAVDVGPPQVFEAIRIGPERAAALIGAAFRGVQPRTAWTLADLPEALCEADPELAARSFDLAGPPRRRVSPVVLPFSGWLRVFGGEGALG